MDLRAAFLILTSFVGLAATGPLRKERSADLVNSVILAMKGYTQEALNHMDAAGLSPGDSCSSVNLDGLREPQPQDVLTADQLSVFGCRLTSVAQLTPHLSGNISLIGQTCGDLVARMGGSVSIATCNVPSFGNDVEKFQHVKCLLKLFARWLSQPSS